MLGRILQAEIEEMIRKRDLRALRDLLSFLEPADYADLLEDLPDEDVAVVFRTAPKDLAAEVFAEMEPPEQEALLHRLPQEHAADLVASLDPDERTAVLDDLPPQVTRRLLSALSPDELKIARRLLAYPEDSVGRLMTPRIAALPERLTASEALEEIRRSDLPEEVLGRIYLVDAAGRLTAALSLPDLVRAEARKRLEEIATNRDPSALRPTDDQERAIEVARRYNLTAVPVTDAAGNLLGAVTVDDLLDAQVEEATEDIHKIGGVVGTDPELRYLDQSALAHIRARVPWVMVLALFGIVSGEIIARFSDYIEKYVLLVVFLPMLAGTGGNVGTQAATVVIRALALEEVKPALGDLLRIVAKEFLIAAGVALGVGLVVFARVFLYATTHPEGDLTGGYGVSYLGATIALAMMLQIVSSTLFGAAAPLGAKALRIDPAVVASPAISTFVDVTGLLIYFSTARAMLG